MSEEQGNCLRKEITGWWIGGGSAETFRERIEKALKELELPPKKDDE